MSVQDNVDRDTIHRIVREEGRMSNPYSDFDTLVSKVEQLYSYIARVAHEGEKATYWDCLNECGIFTGRQGRLLGVIGLLEDENERPLLSAVVVQSNGNMVGERYFDMVEMATNRSGPTPTTEDGRKSLWKDHLREVHDFWGEKRL